MARRGDAKQLVGAVSGAGPVPRARCAGGTGDGRPGHCGTLAQSCSPTGPRITQPRREARGPLLRAWRACERRPITAATRGNDGLPGQSARSEGAGPRGAGPGRGTGLWGWGGVRRLHPLLSPRDRGKAYAAASAAGTGFRVVPALSCSGKHTLSSRPCIWECPLSL